ncbi:uncharacterized protein LOC131219738 isoform X2 [Magnolia sinica]|uniref:uncharacterized protein LOC131219738 isoform X2 n=1 Tax=Magnolia sinica TaxID=86752 RepID=UPI00265B251F|nr:uncharacterized protein LOC131219738 isoform X2 [Magnolia sinica]
MWRFKQFMPKEQTGLEGRTIDIGNLKVHVRNAIAEGGFSCVYLARDVGPSSKQYALKHMICNDEESLDLVKKEVSVMKLLKGHPNVVTLQAHSIVDMGRTKEAFLVMDFCEKSLVSLLENRGAGYFEEKQVLLIFRDVCNAVFAMHSHSPSIAHRDLKVENVLLGPDGAWKLCDFGSISTNHKRFDRAEEMGIEEDNIRKHTTPAYRAPEMWDLFRREILSEKVDIWALGCLLYRICYLKSAFDGESKLQILNGNYRIPDLPRYSSSITDLIKDMLKGSPDTRPDITQVWFRVNEQLHIELQKQMPDGLTSTVAADMQLPNTGAHDEVPLKRTPPRRTPPPPPSSGEQVRDGFPSSSSVKEPQHSRPSQGTSKAAGGGAPLGAFWSTQHAMDAVVGEEKGPIFDEEPATSEGTLKSNRRSPENHHHVDSASPPKGHHIKAGHQQPKKSVHGNSKQYDDGPSKDFEIRFFPEDADRGSEKTKASNPANVGMFQNEAFNTFVAEFDSSKLNSGNGSRSGKEDLEAEVERLKEQLKVANLEKAEITSKYEKLSAICRSQRQEIQELKNALAARTPSPNKDSSKIQNSPGSRQSGTQQGMFTNSSTMPGSDSKTWKAFSDEPKAEQPISKNSQPRSVRTTNGHQNKQAISSSSTWDFGQDSFTAIPASPQISRASDQVSNSQRFGNQKTVETKQASQPAGWAGF